MFIPAYKKNNPIARHCFPRAASKQAVNLGIITYQRKAISNAVDRKPIDVDCMEYVRITR